MGKYAYVKIEYYIISQVNEFVNRFLKNNFKKLQKIIDLKKIKIHAWIFYKNLL